MYKQVVTLDQTSFLELSSRFTGSGEQLMLALRGSKTSKDATVASVLLDTAEVQKLIEHLNGWIATNNGGI